MSKWFRIRTQLGGEDTPKVLIEDIQRRLNGFGIRYVGSVEVHDPELHQWASVSFDVFEHQGEMRLGIINTDNTYGYYSEEDANALYPYAKSVWEEIAGLPPLPPVSARAAFDIIDYLHKQEDKKS
jgi:hypothetical protein